MVISIHIFLEISIHTFLAEGDLNGNNSRANVNTFQSTPSSQKVTLT